MRKNMTPDLILPELNKENNISRKVKPKKATEMKLPVLFSNDFSVRF